MNPSVAPERVIGHVAEIVACLLLKVVQSVVERHPAAEPLATVQSIASAPPRAKRPAVVVMPFVPETVPVATVPIAPVPLPKSTWPPERVVAPVPPFATVSALESVSAPAEENDDVAVAPNRAIENEPVLLNSLVVVPAVAVKLAKIAVPVKVGLADPTKTPDPPVSSEIAPKIPAEVVRPVKAPVPFPRRRPVKVAAPEPPLATGSALENVALVAKRFPAESAVDDAYGNCDAATVDDAKNAPTV